MAFIIDFKEKIFFLIVSIILVPQYLNSSYKNNLKILDKFAEINLIIKGSGKKKIFNNICKSFPEIIEINGFDNDINDDFQYNLTSDINNITLKWNNTTIDCNNMFKGISDLFKINVNFSEDINLVNMSGMFYGCDTLESIDFKLLNTASVIDMSYMFFNCKALTSLNLVKFETYNVQSMSHMFQGCNKIITLNLNNFDTSLVTSMSNMFYGCSSLKSIDIKKFNFSNVQYLEYLFSKCSSLRKIDLSNIDISKAKNLSYIFTNCNKLNSINLSNIKVSSVEDMRYMFYGCTSLKVINFPEILSTSQQSLNYLDTSNVNDLEYMFYNCKNLTSLDLSKFDTSKVTSMAYMFSNCKSLKYLNLENFNTLEIVNFTRMFEECNSLSSLNLSSFKTPKAENLALMFKNCYLLEILDISNFITVTVIEMSQLFNGCKALKSIDLSKFNTENVISMNDMFYNCQSLTSLNLTAFDTSKVTDMYNMFNNCIKLQELDLSNFQTSDLKLTYNMFNNCSSLTAVNLSSFTASKVTDMHNMFNNCTNLKELNLNNFKGNKAKDVSNMFNNCTSLKSVNLDNFNSSNLLNMTNMFKNCQSLFSLNLKSFHTSNVTKMESAFYNCSSLLSLKIDNFIVSSETKIDDLFYNCQSLSSLEFKNIIFCPKEGHFEENNSIYNYHNCKDCNLKSFNQNLCISCNTNNKFYPIENNHETNYIPCYNETPEGYYLSDQVYHKCFNTCKNCYGFGNETAHNCTECIINYLLFDNNCYPECDYYYYFSDKTYYCTGDSACPENYKLISQKKQCIENCLEDGIYNYTYKGLCFERCPSWTNISINDSYLCEDKYECNPNDFFLGKCKLNNTNNNLHNNINKTEENNEDEMINIILKEIKNGGMDELISQVVQNEKNDLMIKDDNLIYQITSSENQNKNKYKNVSSIIFGECEDILMKAYNISENYSLLIFKIDLYQPGASTPIIGYEVYHPITKMKLDLNKCNNSTINFNIPVSIDENNLFKYDPNNEYYKDECIPTASDSDTDILINDRHIEFNDNNLSLCENDCNYNGYEIESKLAQCECGIKSKQLVISELINQTNIFSYNFTNKEKSSNMITMKCYYTLFTKEGLKSNIGSYILIFITTIFAISSIMFYKCGYPLLENTINEIIRLKEEKMKIENMNKKGDINRKETNEDNFRKVSSLTKKRKLKIKKKINNPTKKKKKIKRKNSKKKISESINVNSNSIVKLKYQNVINSLDYKIDENYKPKQLNLIYNNNTQNDLILFNDYELNTMSYKDAIIYDKRNCCEYYCSLVRTKNAFLFSFCPIKDYNSTIIKISLFFLFFAMYYFVNALFFDEKTIHKIYKDDGYYNLIYLIPHICYSFVISHTLNIIIKNIFLSERNICKIKNEKDINKSYDIVDDVKKCLIIKYICFYIMSIIFLLFFWYYLSSFGAVYKNTQIYLIKNTAISLGFSLIYPFFINIIPSILRICSLRSRNEKCKYKISKFIQFI